MSCIVWVNATTDTEFKGLEFRFKWVKLEFTLRASTNGEASEILLPLKLIVCNVVFKRRRAPMRAAPVLSILFPRKEIPLRV
uniref:Uncharacterized protein n=1 Tax=Arcella intermedia TaxID=1963864 RepID=A0A6B2LTK5_9EUKA